MRPDVQTIDPDRECRTLGQYGREVFMKMPLGVAESACRDKSAATASSA